MIFFVELHYHTKLSEHLIQSFNKDFDLVNFGEHNVRLQDKKLESFAMLFMRNL